jgi:hypothetical protein
LTEKEERHDKDEKTIERRRVLDAQTNPTDERNNTRRREIDPRQHARAVVSQKERVRGRGCERERDSAKKRMRKEPADERTLALSNLEKRTQTCLYPALLLRRHGSARLSGKNAPRQPHWGMLEKAHACASKMKGVRMPRLVRSPRL